MGRKGPVPKNAPFSNGHGLVPGATLYQKVREAISVRGFENSEWPTASIDGEGVKALATVRPDPDQLARLSESDLQLARKKMWELVQGMDDLSADLLDAVACLWIEQATSKDQMVWLTADQFLAFRGLMPNRNAAGRLGGYKDEQRRLIAEHLVRLENTWVDVVEMEIVEEIKTRDGGVRRRRKKWKGRSRALLRSSEAGQVQIDGGVDPYAWRVRPGDVFTQFLLGPGRDVVLLSRKALEYDPYRQDVEKRLARFFAYHWRTVAGGDDAHFKVADLLAAAHKSMSVRHPVTTKQRLEQALLTLALDQVITIPRLETLLKPMRQGDDRSHDRELVEQLLESGQLTLADVLYVDFSDDQLGSRGWPDRWLRQGVRVTAPFVLYQLYGQMADAEIAAPVEREPVRERPEAPAPKIIGRRVAEARERRGLSLADVAAQLGITKPYLSMIESGRRNPSQSLSDRIAVWLAQE